jgi:hypothetical protein
MTGVPQVIVTLDPQGKLVAELPGIQATRRQVHMRSGEAEQTLLRILTNQLTSAVEIGLDGAPTQRQVDHWERHQTWPKEGCRWCIAEGRIATGISSRRRNEFLVAGGDVTVRRLKPKESGLPKKAKAKRVPTIVVVQHGRKPRSAEELGL